MFEEESTLYHKMFFLFSNFISSLPMPALSNISSQTTEFPPRHRSSQVCSDLTTPPPPTSSTPPKIPLVASACIPHLLQPSSTGAACLPTALASPLHVFPASRSSSRTEAAFLLFALQQPICGASKELSENNSVRRGWQPTLLPNLCAQTRELKLVQVFQLFARKKWDFQNFNRLHEGFAGVSMKRCEKWCYLPLIIVVLFFFSFGL